jgi:endoglucanase
VLLGLEVVVHATRASRHARDLPGIVATRPPHVLPKEQRKKNVGWDEIFVDVGLPPEEVAQQISVGDLISFRGQVAELKNRRLAGKAFDDRACVAIVTLALKQLVKVQHAWDVLAVATVQEEIGLKGAVTSAYGVAPDLAVALDVTFGKQPGTSDAETVLLGEGPVITLGPNFHPGVVTRLKEVAEAHEIPYQLEPVPGRSGTDAWAIQVSREGVPTGLIGLPLRYMHQPVETLDVRDVERAARLLTAFAAGLEADFLDKLALDLSGELEE